MPSAPLPEAIWKAPAFRTVDEAGRAMLTAGAAQHAVSQGVELCAEGAAGDTFFVVASGSVVLWATRRGDEAPSELRRAGPGDTFGEEPLMYAGAVRRARAVAATAAHVVEVPAALFARVTGKVGGSSADAEVRRLRRNATADLLRTMAATRMLADREVELMLDAVEHVVIPRGQRIFGPGDLSRTYYLVDSGLVQLQTEDAATAAVSVCGYVARGDGFGHEEVLAAIPRRLGAVAMGDTRLATIPASVLRTVVDRNPAVAAQLSRVVGDRAERQASAVAAADVGSTRHVFHDLYRMQVARSLLVIDGESCVRCGHCTWTCAELYGAARLVRRGDKIVTRVGADPQQTEGPKSLMVVNSCQHCKNPACMVDCPTGAIGRDPEGEVFITDALCTGCGACAKACPWENISMGARPDATESGLSELLASKCDLCRGYEAPGCVQSCPTEAITRLDPTRDVAEVANVLGVEAGRGARAQSRTMGSFAVRAGATVLGVSLSLWALAQRAAGVWTPQAGVGWALGWIALAGMLGAATYGVVKRYPRLWMVRRRRGTARASESARPPARSKVRPWLDLHLVLGTVTAVAVCGHAGTALLHPTYGSLLGGAWALIGLGVVGTIAYRLLPSRLARLERKGTLPEDLGRERELLLDSLYRAMSGTSARIKTIAAQVLVPYIRAPWGPWLLLASGRSEREERHALLKQIRAREPTSDGPVGAPLHAADAEALDGLVRVAVEIRSVPSRRLLTFVLRSWLPVHAALGGVVLALLAVHVFIVMGRPS